MISPSKPILHQKILSVGVIYSLKIKICARDTCSFTCYVHFFMSFFIILIELNGGFLSVAQVERICRMLKYLSDF